jgi:hypothetical protein
VVEDASGDAVAGADLLVTDEDGSPVRRAITDGGGRFRVTLPAPGRYRITATRIGFAPSPPEAFEVRAGDTVTIETRLRTAPVALDTVAVVRRAPAVRGEGTLRGAIARRADFPRVGSRRVALSSDPEFRGATRVTDVLRRLAAGGGACTIVHYPDHPPRRLGARVPGRHDGPRGRRVDRQPARAGGARRQARRRGRRREPRDRARREARDHHREERRRAGACCATPPRTCWPPPCARYGPRRRSASAPPSSTASTTTSRSTVRSRPRSSSRSRRRWRGRGEAQPSSARRQREEARDPSSPTTR